MARVSTKENKNIYQLTREGLKLSREAASELDNPLLETEKGIKKAGTFQLICRECDNKIFSDYENPDNYTSAPTGKMITQMALKNYPKAISKRLFETELFRVAQAETGKRSPLFEAKTDINNTDLKEYISAPFAHLNVGILFI